ncbi:hypothetical protein U91I_02289 [alpha proteobacterium U9-1i]|nr:hypothetical protein U91I_02289 [alpha proteobacterium U9-1i]
MRQKRSARCLFAHRSHSASSTRNRKGRMPNRLEEFPRAGAGASRDR